MQSSIASRDRPWRLALACSLPSASSLSRPTVSTGACTRPILARSSRGGRSAVSARTVVRFVSSLPSQSGIVFLRPRVGWLACLPEVSAKHYHLRAQQCCLITSRRIREAGTMAVTIPSADTRAFSGEAPAGADAGAATAAELAVPAPPVSDAVLVPVSYAEKLACSGAVSGGAVAEAAPAAKKAVATPSDAERAVSIAPFLQMAQALAPGPLAS